MKMMLGGGKQNQQSGLGGLASSFLGGGSSAQGGTQGSSGGGGLVGQLAGSLLGGGHKPPTGAGRGAAASSGNAPQGGLMGMAGSLFGGSHGGGSGPAGKPPMGRGQGGQGDQGGQGGQGGQYYGGPSSSVSIDDDRGRGGDLIRGLTDLGRILHPRRPATASRRIPIRVEAAIPVQVVPARTHRKDSMGRPTYPTMASSRRRAPTIHLTISPRRATAIRPSINRVRRDRQVRRGRQVRRVRRVLRQHQGHKATGRPRHTHPHRAHRILPTPA